MTSSIISPQSDKPLTPAMIMTLWVIADELDRQRIPAKVDNAVWLEIPTAALRGPNGRNDNIWLRECLERLTGLQIGGEYRSNPWGAVLVAEWHITQGGTLARILVPPMGVEALRGAETFAKIETYAAYKLNGPARRLYAALADKKRMGKPYWTYRLDELRRVFGVENKKSYERWQAFKQWVIEPALAQINDFGTVTVTMTPEKLGRSVARVRFDWRWKTIDEARETKEENEVHSISRRQDKTRDEAPPLLPEREEHKPRTEEEKRKGLEMLARARAAMDRGPSS